MERFNPFSGSGIDEELKPATIENKAPQPALIRHQSAVSSRNDSSGSLQRQPMNSSASVASEGSLATLTSARYSTSFPDPFGDLLNETMQHQSSRPNLSEQTSTTSTASIQSAKPNNRSNSVTFASSTTSHSIDDSLANISSPTRSGRQTGGGLTSFLSRATSVTSSSVTDRVSGAVGTMKSAVDSLSNQLQQAVPNASGGDQQQSAASYLASKISSATGQFTSSVSGGQNLSSLPVISRQRVVLILDSFNNIDWAQQFNNYRRQMASSTGIGSGGLNSSSASSTLTSFFSSATAQLSSVANMPGSGSSSQNTANNQGSGQLVTSPLFLNDGGVDLVEQADFREVSILANQMTSQATVYVSSWNRNQSMRTAKIIRPEFVVVRQRTKEHVEHLRGIVTALNYCLVPMFEPIEIWNVFQDKRLIFSHLLRIQRLLGKENFPLIQQVYCQTHQDLLNYINNYQQQPSSSSTLIQLPCLVKTGPLGKGRLKVDNLQMLKDFASIIETNNMSCTLEQYLDVKCDLIVQKIGTNLKLFKRTAAATAAAATAAANQATSIYCTPTRQSASRQTSIGSSVLSSFIASTTSATSGQQQSSPLRKNSNPNANINNFEKLSDVSVRYKQWIEAISREFDNKLNAFSLKIIVANNDREYIVGLNDCSQPFIGNQENQSEDCRNFVELIMTSMNTTLPRQHNLISRDSSINTNSSSLLSRRRSSDLGKNKLKTTDQQQGSSPGISSLKDKKKFNSHSQLMNGQSMNIESAAGSMNNNNRQLGQLSSRSQSVSINNQNHQEMVASHSHNPQMQSSQPLASSYFTRRSSDRSDSLTNSNYDDDPASSSFNSSSGQLNSQHQRQTSIGQSLFDQTSTAFSSFQKQSMSFFKRLDQVRTGNDIMLGSTPPQSAKSDKGFDRSFMTSSRLINNDDENSDDDDRGTGDGLKRGLASSGIRSSGAGFKSQSIDSSALDSSPTRLPKRSPPKPPPPNLSGSTRQSSLASYSSLRGSGGNLQQSGLVTTTPNSTPTQTRQNSSVEASISNQSSRNRVVRQNSALSAFEPFDPEVAKTLRSEDPSTTVVSASNQSAIEPRQPQIKSSSVEQTKRSTNYDSASITSGDSNSTNEIATAEDTMNNLKKTFASIFGDKCE